MNLQSFQVHESPATRSATMPGQRGTQELVVWKSVMHTGMGRVKAVFLQLPVQGTSRFRSTTKMHAKMLKNSCGERVLTRPQPQSSEGLSSGPLSFFRVPVGCNGGSPDGCRVGFWDAFLGLLAASAAATDEAVEALLGGDVLLLLRLLLSGAACVRMPGNGLSCREGQQILR